MVSSTTNDLRHLQRVISEKIGVLRSSRKERTALTQQIADMDAELLTIKKSRALVQRVAKKTQEQFEFRFSKLVSMALSAVFGDDAYVFHAAFVERRNRVECDLLLERDGEMIAPEDAVGGGVMDILSFALRIAYWSLKKTAPVFFLDEPFKFLSASLHEQASALLEMLSNRLGIQFFVVSHQEKFVAHANAVWSVNHGKVKEVFNYGEGA